MTEQQIQQFIFRAGFFDRGEGDQRVRPRRRHGCRAHQYREDRRHRRAAAAKPGQGLDLRHQDSADPRDRLGPDRRMRRRALRHSADQCRSNWSAPAANSEHRIENLHDAPVLRLRDRILPLVSLARAARRGAEREAERTTSSSSSRRSAPRILRHHRRSRVRHRGNRRQAGVADAARSAVLFGQHHPGRWQRHHDPRSERHRGRGRCRAENDAEASTQRGRPGSEPTRAQETVILFRAGGTEPKAVPLELVARLEAIDRKQIERSNGQLVVQYRGKLMPLVADAAMSAVHDLEAAPADPRVHRRRAQRRAAGRRDHRHRRDALHGRAQERSSPASSAAPSSPARRPSSSISATICRKRPGDWFHVETESDYGAEHAQKRILLVDDSPFFRNMLQPLLSTAGYDVTAT